MSQVRPLSCDLQKIAECELNEVPARIERDIATFREWISKQAHLHGRTDDQHLISFLRGTKFSLERAKQKYDLFYTVRSALPEIFMNRDPKMKKNLELIRKGLILPLRKTIAPDAPRIFIVRMTLYDPEVYNMNEAMRIFNMMGDLCLLTDDNYVVAGQETLVDFTGSTLAHLGQMSPKMAKTSMLISQDASPIRMKGIHFINTPSGFATVFNMFKGLLNEKNRQRVHVHGSNFEQVYKHIPKDLLPVEYGGTDGTLQDLVKYWEQKLMEHRDYLIDFESFGTDETKRAGNPKYAENLFGVEGSFRKLEVD